jgi:hypothetical protein
MWSSSPQQAPQIAPPEQPIGLRFWHLSRHTSLYTKPKLSGTLNINKVGTAIIIIGTELEANKNYKHSSDHLAFVHNPSNSLAGKPEGHTMSNNRIKTNKIIIPFFVYSLLSIF